MKKSVYIFILTLLSAKFLDILPMGQWFAQLNGVVGQFVLFIWIFYGVQMYKKKATCRFYSRKNWQFVKWVIIGVFLSFIPAYLYYGQSIVTSMIACRVQYFWLVIPLLLFVAPEEKDVIKALNWFSVWYVITFVVRTYINSDLFYTSEELLKQIKNNMEDDVIKGEGFQLLLIPLYYYCGKMKEAMTIRNLLYVFIYMTTFFVIQNRSTLFIAVIIIGFVFLTKRSRYRVPIIFLAIVIGGIIFYQTMDVWIDMYEETITQVTDSDYNRVVAFHYFIFEANKNWVTAVLGNGFLSANTTSKMQDLMDMGIYNSDMGFIGYWNQFGIIPIIVFVVYIIKSLRSHFCPFYVKALSFHILACSMTISYFGSITFLLWFAIFYYLYEYYQLKNVINK